MSGHCDFILVTVVFVVAFCVAAFPVDAAYIVLALACALLALGACVSCVECVFCSEACVGARE